MIGRMRDTLDRIPQAALLLLARLAVAALFLRSGLAKLADWDLTLTLFAEDYRLPLVAPATAAILATGVQIACAALLILGLGTRLATLPLLATTLVIQVFVHPAGWADHLCWAVLLVLVLVRGPGPIAVDALVRAGFDTRPRP